MKALNLVTLTLVVIGAINWGLVGLFHLDLVASIFEAGSSLARIVYIVVGICGVYQLIPLFQAMATDEINAEANTAATTTRSTNTTTYDR